MSFEELLKHSLKKELSDEDLNTKLSVLFGSFPERVEELYSVFKVRTIRDLLGIDFNDLVMEEKKGNIHDLKFIRNCCHNFGFTLSGEYSDLYISDEEALVPISSLDISKRCKNSLLRSGRCYFLGDLLSLDSNTLRNIRNMGDKSYSELVEYLVCLGYSLDPMEESVDEKKQHLRENGEFLVDDIIESRRASLALNRAGIYSVDQLLSVEDVRCIPGVGNVFSSIILSSLREFSLGHNEEEVISTGNEILDKLVDERNRLRVRKAELLVEQVELDSKLSEINNSINNIGVSYDKKKN